MKSFRGTQFLDLENCALAVVEEVLSDLDEGVRHVELRRKRDEFQSIVVRIPVK